MSGRGFSVLTLNCLWHGAPRQRLAAIAPLLDASRNDFLCLQEIVLGRHVRLLENALPAYRPAVCQRLALWVTGGLVSFARHPVERSAFEAFDECGQWWTMGAADRLLRKGFLVSWVRRDGLPVVVVNTHLLANYDEDWSPENRFARQQRSELDQLSAALTLLDPAALLVVAGDLNVPGDNSMFRDFIARCGLRDAFAGDPGQARRIDHILYRHPSGGELRVDARYRFTDPLRLADGRTMRASDHLAVEATIHLD